MTIFSHFPLLWKPCYISVYQTQCSHGDNIWIKSYSVSTNFRKDKKLQEKKNIATEAKENIFQISKLTRQTQHLNGLQGQNTETLKQTNPLIFSSSFFSGQIIKYKYLFYKATIFIFKYCILPSLAILATVVNELLVPTSKSIMPQIYFEKFFFFFWRLEIQLTDLLLDLIYTKKMDRYGLRKFYVIFQVLLDPGFQGQNSYLRHSRLVRHPLG